MKYEVTITETLQRTIIVEADNQSEAEEIVEKRWINVEYVLNASDFVDVDFNAKEM